MLFATPAPVSKRTRRYAFPWNGHRTALVAHEDPHAQKYLMEALSRAGYTAVVCGDTRIVLERRRTAGHSFAILKNDEPVMETLRALRKQGNQIPIILLSGADVKDCSVPDPEIGNVGHLSAPFTLETLQLAIDNIDHYDPIGPTSTAGDP